MGLAAMLNLVVESWIWYGVTVLVAAARFGSRAMTFGTIKKYQVDDYIMAGALCTYTTFLVAINIVSNHNSNLLPPGYDVAELTTEDIANRQYGSKMILVVEICQCVTIWAVKACLLIMYYRLTMAMKENYVVKALAVYTAFGFLFMMVFYLGVWCRPFNHYWAVPTQSQCSAATNHLITNATFNLSSDLLMLALALQMFVRSHLPWRRKLILCGIFGLGAFVILAAVLNKYYSFTSPFGGEWTYWYVRESSTALLVANLPYTWTLLRRVFKLRAFNPENSSTNGQPKSRRWRGGSTGGSVDSGSARKSSEWAGHGQTEHARTGSRSGSGGAGRTSPVDKDIYRLPSLDEPFSPEQTSFGHERLDKRDDTETDLDDRDVDVRGVEQAHVTPERMV